MRKAFDTVWHTGLLVKLHQKGVRGHIWHLIKNWYSSSFSCVLWDGHRSTAFELKQGVRQGGILSHSLYCIFVDELLDQLSTSGYGVAISDIYCGAPMYADDIALVADSPSFLQAMLDIVHTYAQNWRYQLNSVKSVAMVIGETAATRRKERTIRKRNLGSSTLQEVDEQHHLGILRSVLNSTTSRTNERATAGRSSFFVLNSVGSRFGCLHPLTSLRLYRSLCLPILLYGSELWFLTKTELLFLEQAHRKILRTILGLPLRCPSSSLTTLLGLQSVEDNIKQRMLGFIVSTVNLPSDSLPRKILMARANSSNPKGVVKRFNEVLSDLNLPDLSELLSSPPKTSIWKSHTKKHLALRAQLEFLESCEMYHISSCHLKLLRPASHWSVTVGNPALTRINNFRIRLLVGCNGLEKDASRFRSRNTGAAAGDSTCKLCASGTEDAEHFISSCQALSVKRLSLLQDAPPSVLAQLPDPTSDPKHFSDIMLIGTCWIDDPDVQCFCIQFLNQLKVTRANKLFPTTGP